MGGKKILVVEDHPDVRRAFVKLLRLQGYEVQEAENVSEAIARLDGQVVALLDLFLPDGLGTEVFAYIRRQDRFTRVAFVTAAYDIESVQKMLMPNVDAIFRKPIEFQSIIDWIESPLVRSA